MNAIEASRTPILVAGQGICRSQHAPSPALLTDLGLTAQQRALRSKLGAHSLHAKVNDASAHTAPARQAFLDRFEREVDPDRLLSLPERARRAEHARKAYFAKLAFNSAKARRNRKAAA